MRSFLNLLSRRRPLGPDLKADVLDLQVERRTLRANADFGATEDVLRFCYVIEEGAAARYVETIGKKRQITALLLPGDIANSRPLVSAGPLTNFATLVPTTVVLIQHADLGSLIARHPQVAEALWDQSVVDASIAEQWIANVGRRDAATRLAHLIAELAFRYEQTGRLENVSFELLLTQEHLADLTGLTSVHVNRMLQLLRAEGLITTIGGRLVIEDLAGLRRRGDFDAGYLKGGLERARVAEARLDTEPKLSAA